MAYCLICKDIESSSHSNFCYADIDGWVKSPERKEVDWTSDESYNQAVEKYAARVLQERNVEATNVPSGSEGTLQELHVDGGSVRQDAEEAQSR